MVSEARYTWNDQKSNICEGRSTTTLACILLRHTLPLPHPPSHRNMHHETMRAYIVVLLLFEFERIPQLNQHRMQLLILCLRTGKLLDGFL